MKILVIGSGGREHAIVRALDGIGSDGQPHELHAAPGNPGIGQLASLHPLDVSDAEACAVLAADLDVDLVVIGPEIPLVAGAADAIRARGIACFGPDAAAAKLEGSKAFAKEIMAAADVPTSLSYVCADSQEAAHALDSFGAPYVVKDDGLAAGKGVVVTSDRDEALAHAQACFDVGGQVVIEEYLDGPELSLFCVCDGHHVVPLAPARDFKREYDGDEGANTGGMGAYSPVPGADAALVDEVVERVALPTVRELAKRGTPFVGLLYCGLALTRRGVRVIEFNAGVAAPETQVVLPRLATPLATVLWAAATGELDQLPPLRWDPAASVGIVLAAPGYPRELTLGGAVTGIEDAAKLPGVSIVQAGTARDGELVASGGRVLTVVGRGGDLEQARQNAYAAIAKVSLKGAHYRRDIALAASADARR